LSMDWILDYMIERLNFECLDWILGFVDLILTHDQSILPEICCSLADRAYIKYTVFIYLCCVARKWKNIILIELRIVDDEQADFW
jgi:hypothetical protein